MKQNLKLLRSYYQPYRKVFYADLFFALLAAAVALTNPLIIRYIYQNVVHMNFGDAYLQIALWGLVLLALIGVEAYSMYFVTYYGHVMGVKIQYDMRTELFSHYQKLSFSFFDDQKVGQLMSRMTNDLFDISELLHHGPEDLLISSIKLIGSFIILSLINWKLAILAFIIIPFMVIFASKFNGKMKAAFKDSRAKIAVINSQIEDNLSGIRAVKSFANEDVEMDKFQEGNDGFLHARSLSYKYMAGFHSGLGAMTTFITVIVVVIGAIFTVQGSISVTDLITFILYISVFTEPVRKLINFTETFLNGYSGYERFREIMEIEPDIVDEPDAVDIHSLEGNIEFKDVSFSYNQSNSAVLKHVNLKVNAGEYMALVGSSGVGKSTLCSLIPRFYEVTGGSILIDGMDIRHMTMNSLRQQIGIVQQDVYLFAGTIKDNISYGRPNATQDDIIHAAIEANAHDFIMELPDGYDTDIGQRGVKLSGGQKQRISIARVFLKNPSILIFDEATSSLDNESERVVQESLEKLAINRTTFVIAHRLSTIRNAGKILVLTENGIDESGTHEELLAKKGMYERLYNMQFKDDDPFRS